MFARWRVGIDSSENTRVHLRSRIFAFHKHYHNNTILLSLRTQPDDSEIFVCLTESSIARAAPVLAASTELPVTTDASSPTLSKRRLASCLSLSLRNLWLTYRSSSANRLEFVLPLSTSPSCLPESQSRSTAKPGFAIFLAVVNHV